MCPKYASENSANVRYGKNIVKSIVSLATLEVDGVHSLQGKKIVIDKNGDIFNIDVFIDVLSTVACADLAYLVQDNVKRTLESMTKYKAGNINVNVLGVHFIEKN